MRPGIVDVGSMSKFSCHIYLPSPVRHGSVGCGFLSTTCLARLRKPRSGSVGGGLAWTNLRHKGIPGSPSELWLCSIYQRRVIRHGRSCHVNVTTGVDGHSVVRLIAKTSSRSGFRKMIGFVPCSSYQVGILSNAHSIL